MFLFAPASGHAQSVVATPEYVRENWTVADGLPINTITAIVQTRDGYLWLGTNDGVVRFDGFFLSLTLKKKRSAASGSPIFFREVATQPARFSTSWA